jgi:hypothetical protein
MPNQTYQDLESGYPSAKNQELKYFTPNVEDFRAGYSCEVLSEIRNTYGELAGTEWMPYTIKQGVNYTVRNNNASVTLSNVIMYPPLDKVRVPYLTKEQLEKEGWQIRNTALDNMIFIDKGNYMGVIRFMDEDVILGFALKDPIKLDWMPDPENFRVTVPCKDINTFRYICKLLGI